MYCDIVKMIGLQWSIPFDIADKGCEEFQFQVFGYWQIHL